MLIHSTPSLPKKKIGKGRLYFKMDFILVKALSKSTLCTYFPGAKIKAGICFFPTLNDHCSIWCKLVSCNVPTTCVCIYIKYMYLSNSCFSRPGVFNEDNIKLEIQAPKTGWNKWKVLRGYCTPGQFLDCFCIFLKNYNTLVTTKICFL